MPNKRAWNKSATFMLDKAASTETVRYVKAHLIKRAAVLQCSKNPSDALSMYASETSDGSEQSSTQI